MAKPITKACFHVSNPNDIPYVFENAFKIASEGRPGPVLIDIPMDVQRAQIEDDLLNIDSLELSKIDSNILLELIENIKKAERPLILSGRGIRASKSQELFDDFISKTKVPVITTLLGLDTIKYDNSRRVGFIGSYGNRWANIAFGECDLLIVLGSRLDIRQTGADAKFIENRKIYHIDCEKGEVNNRVKGCKAIIADLKSFFYEFKNWQLINLLDLKMNG
ncbi:hypothetical protein ACQ9BO_26150 [Flavobacterium sp. P21]|uniref:hypothetical protein n=1 Tax=Flavobacterium sp. P21 TaxID=3423948 RepID=UPI003D6725CC